METQLTPSARVLENQGLCILLVEDDAEDASILQRLLKSCSSGPVSVVHCIRLGDIAGALSERPFDVVLLDMFLPDGEGLSAMPELLESGTPIVVLTGCDDQERGIEAVRRGAQDYLPKSQLTHQLLSRSLFHAIEREKLHRELLAAHRREQELKDDVLSHVSHELRTPLTAVSSFVGILRDGIAGALTPKQAEYVAIVERNVGQLKRLIGDLMDVARLCNGKMTLDIGLVDVGSCIADVFDAASGPATLKGIELSAECKQVPPLLGDQLRICQVLQNLVDNAIKFTPNSGKVIVKAALQNADLVSVSVEDTGCGIPQELQSRIFERLQQGDSDLSGSRRGLGLGLWIARELVRSMHGSISVESAPGIGSRFKFSIPVYSIENLVSKALGGDSNATLMLIRLEIRAEKGKRGCTHDNAKREGFKALQRSIIAATDLVIPETMDTPTSIVLFALARTNRSGAEAICQRLTEECANPLGQLRRCGFQTRVSIEDLDAMPDRPVQAGIVTKIRECLRRRSAE